MPLGSVWCYHIIYGYTKYSRDYQNAIALQVIVLLFKRRNEMLVITYLTEGNKDFQKLKLYTEILRRANGCEETNMEESPSLPFLEDRLKRL